MITAYPKSVEVALAVGTDAYTAGDVVGGLITFDVDSPGNGGYVSRVKIVDDADQKEAYKLYVFDEVPSTIADDAAFAPTVADLKKLINVIAIAAADYTTINGNAYAIKSLGADIVDFKTVSGENLYAYLVCDDTPDYAAATDLTIEIQAWTF